MAVILIKLKIYIFSHSWIIFILFSIFLKNQSNNFYLKYEILKMRVFLTED